LRVIEGLVHHDGRRLDERNGALFEPKGSSIGDER
jgi:hypothetical protein